jgi:arylamine N-acetyltransferase
MKNNIFDQFLDFLQVEQSDDRLLYLHHLVRSHQTKVKWENLTKMIDYEKGYETNSFLPSIDTYVQRVTQKGMGGTCWTLAIGLHELLRYLDYDVSYVYMDPGHLCLRVDLDQPYYVDVGYCAPLFKAYPMFESFVVRNNRETFYYNVTDDEIKIIREPGPTKILYPNPVTLDEMMPKIVKSNDWQSSPPLKDIMIFGYIDDVPTSVTNNVLKQYFKDQKVELQLNDEELEYWITQKFNMDIELYKAAVEIFQIRRVK